MLREYYSCEKKKLRPVEILGIFSLFSSIQKIFRLLFYIPPVSSKTLSSVPFDSWRPTAVKAVLWNFQLSHWKRYLTKIRNLEYPDEKVKKTWLAVCWSNWSSKSVEGPNTNNTNTQIHKYTNTTWVKVTNRPNICYIFEKVMVQGSQNQSVFSCVGIKNV